MIEILWNGHNDLFMGVLILWALYLAFKEKFNLSIIVLTISCLSKYLSLVLLPFFFIYYFSKGTRSFPLYGLLISSSLVIFSIKYFDPFAIRFNEISNNILLCHKSLQRTVSSLYKVFSGQGLGQETNLVFLGLFMLAMMFLIYKFIYSEKKKSSLFYFSFFALYLLIFIFSAKFHSWYLFMMFPFAVLIVPRFMLILCLSLFAFLTFLDQANIANFL